MHKNGENAVKSLTNGVKAGNLNKKLNPPALKHLVIFMRRRGKKSRARPWQCVFFTRIAHNNFITFFL